MQEAVWYIHIGLRKSGSSSIQSFLARNADRLAEKGICYPEFGRLRVSGLSTNHMDLARAVWPKHAGGRDFSDWEKLLKADFGQYVLSSEDFGQLPAESIKKIADALGRRGVKIIAYVRETAATLISEYNQQTKRGRNLLDFDQFFERLTTSPGQRRNLSPYPRLAAWAQAFGWEALRIRELSPAVLSGGTLLSDFLTAVGLDEQFLRLADPKSLEQKNSSVPWELVEVIRDALGKSPVLDLSRRQQWADQTLHHYRMQEGKTVSRQRTIRYLTRAQQQLLSEIDQQAREELARASRDCRFARPACIPDDERLRLPDASLIPAPQRRTYAALVAAAARDIEL